MPRKKKPNRDRVDLRAEPAWVDRAARIAARLGMNLSTFIRMATSRYMDEYERDFPVELKELPRKPRQ